MSTPTAPTRFAMPRKTETAAHVYKDRAKALRTEARDFASVSAACDRYFRDQGIQRTPWNEFGSTRKTIVASENATEESNLADRGEQP
jgi:hypothetical protein